MRKLLLTIALFAFVPFVHAFHPDNIYTVQTVERWGGSQPYNETRPLMVIFSLRNAPTQLYTTGIITREVWGNQYEARNYVGTPFTANNIVEYLKFSRGTHEYSNLSQSSQSGGFENKDLNGNAIPDFREYIAGGEPLYWTSCGNGWQFYVNGAMKVCNSDTNWETVPYTQVPPSVATEYPDEDHNGIPDIVDAAIAAGGGATSNGGNISVTVNTADNTAVLQAINALSEQITALSSGSGSGSGSATPSVHCEALELKPNLDAIEEALTKFVYGKNGQDIPEILTGINYLLNRFITGVWPDHVSNLHEKLTMIQTTGDLQLEELEGINDTLTTIEHHMASSYPIFATHLETIAQEAQTQTQLLQSIEQYLTSEQKDKLSDIASNTQGTVQKLTNIIEILNRLNNTQFDGIENKPEMEEADDIVSESSEGVDEKKREFEEEDKGEGEDDSNKIKDNDNVDKKTGSERIRDKIFRALGVDLNHLRQSSQEDEQITLKISNEKMVAAIGKRVPTATLNMSLHLDPRKWTGGGNWHESDNLQGSHAATIGTFSQYVVPYMDIARGLCLFVFGWAFISSLFDLFRDAWSY